VLIVRVTNEEKRDPSDRGIRAATTARAAVPTEENKRKQWERIKSDKDSSLHIMASVMSGFR
jgi:aminopeptidase N